MRRKQKLIQCDQSTKESCASFCIACTINNSECPKQNVDLTQIFSIFCKYFKFNSSQFTNLHNPSLSGQNSQNSLSLFCLKCMELLEKLWSQDVQLKILQNDISRTVALFACNILQTTNGNQNIERNGTSSSQVTDRNGEKSKMAQIIRQQFSPQVVIQDLYKNKNPQLQNQSQTNCDTEEEEEDEDSTTVIKDEGFDDWDYAEREIVTDEYEKQSIISEVESKKVESRISKVPLNPSCSPEETSNLPRILRKRCQKQQNINSKTTTTTENNKIIHVEVLSTPNEVSTDNLNSINEIPLLDFPTNYCTNPQVEIVVEGGVLLFDAVSDSTCPSPDTIDTESSTTIVVDGKEWIVKQMKDGKFKCPVENCSLTRRSALLIKAHMMRGHKKELKRRKPNKNKSQLNIPKNNNDEETLNTINFQGTVFNIEQVENGQFLCPIENCNKIKTSKKNLKLHVKRVHEKMRATVRKRKPVEIVVVPPENSEEEKELMINLCGRDWMIEKLVNGKFKCPIENCMEKGIRSTIELVKNHMNQIHTKKTNDQRKTRQNSWVKVEDSSFAGMYQCRKCSEMFDSKKSFFLHYRSTHKFLLTRKYRRPKGRLTEGPTPGTFLYRNKWLIETIPTEENNPNTFRCRTCLFEAQTQKGMSAHIVDIHLHSMSQKSTLVCSVCNYTCLKGKGPTYFLSHMKRHHGTEIPEVVSVGNSRFMYKAKWFFGLHENEYKCFECQSATSNQEEMLQHLESQHSDYLICELCGLKFRSPQGLQSHIVGFHSNLQSLGDGKFSCHFGQQDWLFEKIEEQYVGLNQTTRYKCGSCSSKIWGLGGIKHHIKSQHIGRQSYVCDNCGKTFTCLSSLQEHTKVLHSAPEYLPFICSTCGLGFKSKTRMRFHEEKHKEWRCPNCKKIFQYKKGLENHLRKHCSGVEGNNCPSCHVYFKRKDSLQLHIDSGECTGNSTNSMNKRLSRKRQVKVPEQNDLPVSKPKKKKTGNNSSSMTENTEETATTSTVEEIEGEELATEVWNFGIDQN